ncbi:MAG: PP2C family protein-serine/threonine phosphatase [Planctomycetota bacterium]|jgi:sigma-B regulation protein RsbU (phosphoserine phosphatase)
MSRTRRDIERNEQIYQLSTLVAGAFSLPEVLDRLAEAAVKIVGVKACSIRLLDEETNDLRMRSTYGLSEAYRNKGPVTMDNEVIRAAFAGQAIVIDDMRVDSRIQYRDATLREGLVSQLTVAMQFRNRSIGVLRLYSPRPKGFKADDTPVARAVASQCALAITNAKLYAEAIAGQRMAEQMRLAGLIQRRMIPDRAPDVKGLDIAAKYIPCFDVGGDFYDFLPLSEGRLIVTIADVIGKGVPAAIMMSWFRGALQAYTEGFREVLKGAGPLEIDLNSGIKAAIRAKNAIENFNKMACIECREGEFITLFYAIIDAVRRTVTYCSCGHEPPVLIRAGRTQDLDKGGLVLGVDPQAQYEIETVRLRDGDCLLFYTDGLVDAMDFGNELWGRDRMLEAVMQFADCPADHVVRNLLAYRRRFSGLARQVDDTSLIAVKVGPPRQTGDACECELSEGDARTDEGSGA